MNRKKKGKLSLATALNSNMYIKGIFFFYDAQKTHLSWSIGWRVGPHISTDSSKNENLMHFVTRSITAGISNSKAAMLCLKGSSKDCRLEYSTMVCAAIRAANMLLPGGPGAQKDTLICVPPSSLPSVSRCASSAISAVANSSTAKRRKLPSCPWANCGERREKLRGKERHKKIKKREAIFQAYREKQKPKNPAANE